MLLTHSIGQHRPGQLPTIPALIVLFFIFLFTIAALIHDPWIAYGGNPPGDRDPVQGQKILVLCSYGYSLPTYQKLNPALLVALKTGGVGTNDLFFEYLDLLHIHDGQQRLAVVDMLRAKYTKLGIDLVVSLHSPAMSLLLSDAADIFPGTPLVSWDMQAEFHEDDSTRRVFRTVTSLDVKGTLTWALELFPNAERVVFVSGGSEGDRLVEAAARRSLADWENKLQVEYLTNSSVEEILARVADLPPQSIVVYGSIFKDKTGRSFTPSDVGDRVAKAANAPVFCLYDTNIGRGMVGGSLLSFEAEGSRIGMFALNILRGELEETTAKTGKPVLMFDWQQIKRWGGNTSNLPEGTIFLNPPTSLWSQYAWHIIGFLFILLALLLLIGSLLVQRRHRKLAELELRVSNATLEQRVADRMVQLQEKEARYSSLFNSMTEGFALHEIIFGVDGKPVDYRFLEINPAFERLTGLSRETVIGKTIRQIMPEIEANWRVDTYSPVALDGIPVHIESYSVFLNHWYEVYAHQTTPGQFALFFTDITERKDTEEKLRQLSYFPEEDPNPVVRCTPEGSIMYTNVPAANWLATFDRQTGGFASLPEPVREAVAEACRHNQAIEVEIINPAGRTFAITIIQPPGEAYVNLYAIDLTIRKKALEELEHQLRNIEELNQSLQATNKLLEEKRLEAEIAQNKVLHAGKLAAIGELSASIAHEFNNPLQGIMTILKGLKRRAILEDDDKELLDLAISESDRMKNLIRSLQDFNRPSSGKKTLMDVHASIDSLLLLCKSDFKRKGISTVLNYAERLPQILAISDQIKQVILNLLNNAADACIKPDRVITITTWQEKNSIAMAIKDNGIGIKPEEIALIFQPFHSTKSEVKGPGLGLSICHGIVQNHHGEIRVESQPGEGSAFTVLLPIEEE